MLRRRHHHHKPAKVNRRASEVADAAARLGLQFTVADHFHLDRLPFAFLRVHEVRQVANTAWGTVEGMSVWAFDVWLRRRPGGAPDLTCVATVVTAGFPGLAVVGTDAVPGTEALEDIGYHPVAAPGALGDRFDVFAADPDFAAEFLRPEMAAWLAEGDAHDRYETAGPYLLMAVPAAPGEDLPGLLDHLKDFRAHLAPGLAARYPPQATAGGPAGRSTRRRLRRVAGGQPRGEVGPEVLQVVEQPGQVLARRGRHRHQQVGAGGLVAVVGVALGQPGRHLRPEELGGEVGVGGEDVEPVAQRAGGGHRVVADVLERLRAGHGVGADDGEAGEAGRHHGRHAGQVGGAAGPPPQPHVEGPHGHALDRPPRRVRHLAHLVDPEEREREPVQVEVVGHGELEAEAGGSVGDLGRPPVDLRWLVVMVAASQHGAPILARNGADRRAGGS